MFFLNGPADIFDEIQCINQIIYISLYKFLIFGDMFKNKRKNKRMGLCKNITVVERKSTAEKSLTFIFKENKTAKTYVDETAFYFDINQDAFIC